MTLLIDGYSKKETEENGVWVAITGGHKICIARAGGSNVQYKTALRALLRQYAKDNHPKTGYAPHISDEIDAGIKKLVAKYIIRDWKVTSGGKDIAFNYENVLSALDHDDFFSDVMESANERASFVTEEELVATKNSRKPSAGN
jgi:hypothetical protein